MKKETISSALDLIWDDLHDPNTQGWNPLSLDPQKFLVLLSGLLFTQLVLPIGGLFGGPGQLITGLGAFGFNALNPKASIGWALAFIALAVLVYSMFKLLLRLINNFLSIIFLTISAPFQFLFASLPGRQGIATDWMRNMLCNVLAFPAVLGVFYFVAFLLGESKGPLQVTGDAGLINGAAFPLFGGLDLKFVNLLLAFGALVATPAIPDIICRAIGKVGQAGQLIGQEIGGSVGQGRQYAGQFQQGVGGAFDRLGPATTQSGYIQTGAGIQRVNDPRFGARFGFLSKLEAWRRGVYTSPE